MKSPIQQKLRNFGANTRRTVSPAQPWMTDPYCCSVQSTHSEKDANVRSFFSYSPIEHLPPSSFVFAFSTRHSQALQVVALHVRSMLERKNQHEKKKRRRRRSSDVTESRKRTPEQMKRCGCERRHEGESEAEEEEEEAVGLDCHIQRRRCESLSLSLSVPIYVLAQYKFCRDHASFCRSRVDLNFCTCFLHTLSIPVTNSLTLIINIFCLKKEIVGNQL